MRTLFTLLLCAAGLTVCRAQTDFSKFKYGDVTAEDLAMTVAPGDSAAEAYVLYDLLQTTMEWSPKNMPILVETRHRQVKLLKPSSFERADFEIVYYKSRQHVTNIRAQIHLPDGEVIKIRKGDIIREKLDDERNSVKFTFPQVTEGAVLEYSWKTEDEGITVPSRYYFQEDIPVRWAEYQSVIPKYYRYASLGNAANFTVNETETVMKPFAGRSILHKSIRWAMADLPAYDVQPYVNNLSDYLPRVRFQLASVSYPNQPVQRVFSDWSQTTKKLMTYSEFGLAYRNKSNCRKTWKIVEPKLASLSSETEKAAYLYNFVAGRIKWDGNYSWMSERKPDAVFEAAEGNSGEMSMLLLALLNRANIAADPVLVPLRDRGAPIELYPIVTQFDHLMILATVDGKEIFLDPNDIDRPPGLPRYNALNGRAFVASDKAPQWVSVIPPRAEQIVVADIVLDEEGMGEVAIKSRLNSYYAFTGRNRMDNREDDTELPIAALTAKMFPELEVTEHEVKDADNVSGPLSLNLKMKVPMGQAIDDYLYFQPILTPVLEKALADVEQRIYPVDFGYPWNERYISTITLPEGYELEEMPESVRIMSEDGSMKCTLTTADKGNGVVSVNLTVGVGRTIYQPKEYTVLQQMFRQIIDAQETTIVLKKAKK